MLSSFRAVLTTSSMTAVKSEHILPPTERVGLTGQSRCERGLDTVCGIRSVRYRLL